VLDFLEKLEPYTSYRFALALVLAGLTGYFLWTSWAAWRNFQGLLEDLNEMTRGARLFDEARLLLYPDFLTETRPPLRARPGNIVRLALFGALARMLRPLNLLRLMPELLLLAAVSAACGVAYWHVFTLQ
jgi:hypothetical protein